MIATGFLDCIKQAMCCIVIHHHVGCSIFKFNNFINDCSPFISNHGSSTILTTLIKFDDARFSVPTHFLHTPILRKTLKHSHFIRSGNYRLILYYPIFKHAHCCLPITYCTFFLHRLQIWTQSPCQSYYLQPVKTPK